MKLRKLFLAAGLALVAAGATAQVNVEDIRIYTNQGGWTVSPYPMYFHNLLPQMPAAFPRSAFPKSSSY